MLSKKNRKQYDLKHANGRQHFALRKTTLGLASVLLSTTLYLGGYTDVTVQAADQSGASTNTTIGQSGSSSTSETINQSSAQSIPMSQSVVEPDKLTIALSDAGKLTDAEKQEITSNIMSANPNVINVSVDNNGTATLTFKDNSTATLDYSKTVKVVTSSQSLYTKKSDADKQAQTYTRPATRLDPQFPTDDDGSGNKGATQLAPASLSAARSDRNLSTLNSNTSTVKYNETIGKVVSYYNFNVSYKFHQETNTYTWTVRFNNPYGLETTDGKQIPQGSAAYGIVLSKNLLLQNIKWGTDESNLKDYSTVFANAISNEGKGYQIIGANAGTNQLKAYSSDGYTKLFNNVYKKNINTVSSDYGMNFLTSVSASDFGNLITFDPWFGNTSETPNANINNVKQLVVQFDTSITDPTAYFTGVFAGEGWISNDAITLAGQNRATNYRKAFGVYKAVAESTKATNGVVSDPITVKVYGDKKANISNLKFTVSKDASKLKNSIDRTFDNAFDSTVNGSISDPATGSYTFYDVENFVNPTTATPSQIKEALLSRSALTVSNISFTAKDGGSYKVYPLADNSSLSLWVVDLTALKNDFAKAQDLVNSGDKYKNSSQYAKDQLDAAIDLARRVLNANNSSDGSQTNVNNADKALQDALKLFEAKNVTKPAVRSNVDDPSKLTDDEKARLSKAITDVNTNVDRVEYDGDSVIVVFTDGAGTLKITDITATNPELTPVANVNNLTDAEKVQVKNAIIAKNNGLTADNIEVAQDGTATLTYSDGTKATIPADKTVKAGQAGNVHSPATTVPVPEADKTNLTDSEKQAIEKVVSDANQDNNVKSVVSDNQGNVTVTFEDGSQAIIDKSKTVGDVDKTDLSAELEKAKAAQTSQNYTDSDDDKKQTLIDKITEAEKILTGDAKDTASQDDVKSATDALKAAIDALNGVTKLSEAKTQAETDLSGLTKLNNAQMQTAKDAVSNAKTVADVTAAVSAAKNTNTNMGTLAADENYTKADEIKASLNYTNADEDKQKAYTDAFDKVKKLLDKENGSSTKDVTTDADAVQEAQTELDNAAQALNGQAKFDTAKQKALDTVDDNYPHLNNAQKATAKKRINDATTPEQLSAALETNAGLEFNMEQMADKTVYNATVGTNNYTNADPDKKQAFDNVVKQMDTVTAADGPDWDIDQTGELNSKFNTVTHDLNGDARMLAKQALQTAHDNGESGKATDYKYYNASETLKSAYDQALTDAATALADANTTYQQYLDARKAIQTAYEKLDGTQTTKVNLEAAIAKANTAKGNGTYDNSSDAAKSALDAALEVAKSADKDTNASQATVDDATKKLTDALAGLDNTQAKDIQAPETLVPVPAANKDSVIQSDKDAIVANVKAVNPNADTVEVADDGSAVVTFKDGSKATLDKSKTVGDVDKSELTTENTTAKAALETANFKNADSDKQAALTSAIAEADAILTGSKKDTATQADVKTATDNLKNALANLNGDNNLSSAKNTINGLTNLNNNQKQTALSALDGASSASDITNVVNAAKDTDDQMAALKADSNLTAADDIKKSTNYLEADPDKKAAFDTALAAAQAVTNQETGGSTNDVTTDANHVSEIKKALDDAANALNGEARKAAKQALQKAHDDGESGKTTDSKYYNASADKKTPYDQALTNAAETLANNNATLADYQNAKTAIDDAYKALDGQATNKQELQSRVRNADNVRQSNDYKNASDKARQDYEAAITAGQGVLANDNATQAEVNTARDNIDKAKQALTTSANSAQSKVNSNVTPTPVGDKTNLTSDEQAAIKKAVEDANQNNDVKEVSVDPNSGDATVTFNDGSKATIPASKTTTDTNKTRLKNDLDDSKTDATKAIHDKASTATKEAYDKAVSAGQTVFDNDKASQKAIDEAADAIESAKKAMENSANAAQSKVNTNIDKTAVGNKDALTSDEQETVKNAAEKGNPGTTVSVDDKGTATVTFDDGSKATIAPEYTVKGTDKSSLVKELNNETAVKNTQTVTLPDSEDNTPIQIYQRASDEARKAYDDAIANGKTVNQNTTATQDEIDKATKDIQDAVKGLVSSSTNARLNFDFSFDKTPVVDPSNVSEAEKQAILDKIAAKNDNIDKSKSTVNADGSATIVLTDGSSVTLTSNQTIKDVNKDELRQDIATADKVKADTTNYKKASDEARSNFEAALSDAKEKEAGKFSQADVDTSDANLKKAISALQTSINSASANNPATKTPVGRGRDVNEDESATIKAAVSDANPGNKGVVVNSDGSATVTLANGGQVTIPASATTQDTNKTALKTALDNGNAAIKGSDFTNASTTAQEELKKAVQDGQDVFDNAGSSQKEIDDAASAINTALDKVTKSINDAKGKVITDITKTPVGDKTNLTDDEKKQVAENVKQAVETKTPSENVTVNVNNDGSATVTFNDGSKATVSGTDTVKDTDKTKLKAALDEAPTVESGSDFTNASTETQNNYKQAVEAGQKVFDNPTSTQKSIDEATEAINNAKQALADSAKSAAEKLDVNVDKTQVGNKQALNQTEKDRVQAAVTTAVKTKTPDAEFSVSVDDQGNATVTFDDGSKGVISSDKTVTDVDKSGLQSDVSEKPTLEKTPAYYNASEEAKSAYDDAITAGQEVLDNSTATKDEVDKARANIAKAKEGLTGQATNKEELQKSIATADNIIKTDVYSNASTDQRKAVDEALAEANKQNSDAVATQKKVDTAQGNLDAALGALNQKNQSSDIQAPKDKVTVTNPDHLTDPEKTAVVENVKKVNDNAKVVTVANDGYVTVVFADGSTGHLTADEVRESHTSGEALTTSEDNPAQAEQSLNDFDKVSVSDPDKLTDSEKNQVAENIKKANSDKHIA
ncbi:YSIRK-type signal peptide-containing protein, partial [Lactobacillus mulieris]